jgi:hypothetical protein
MKTNDHRQLRLAQPTSARGHRQPCRVLLAWKRKAVGVAGAGKMGVLLPIPLQASAGKSTTK